MRPRRPLWFGLLAAGLVVAAFIWVAPPQLGGSTTYSATVGTSMQPMFYKGDLALVRPASDYKVGDVALYESPVLHRPVLHRIIVIQGTHYYFKGDNNDFVDPGYATRGDILGQALAARPEGRQGAQLDRQACTCGRSRRARRARARARRIHVCRRGGDAAVVADHPTGSHLP